MEILIFNFCFIYISGLIFFSVKQKHLLLMLLSLEFIMLSIYMLIFIYLMFFYCSGFINIIFLTFAVCEGVLGLSIMISLIRTHGNDYFQSFNLLW